MKIPYSEKLKAPRWQRKRLEILSRAGFECQECLDNSSTLEVHHSYYESQKDPWDYPDESLLCLCKACHSIRHNCQNQLLKELGLWSSGGISILAVSLQRLRTVKNLTEHQICKSLIDWSMDEEYMAEIMRTAALTDKDKKWILETLNDTPIIGQPES